MKTQQAKEIFVSYAWAAERETKIVDELKKHYSQQRGINLLVDHKEVKHGKPIDEFMERLSSGQHIIIVFSNAYFKSKWCMYELLKIHRKGCFEERVFPIIVDGCDLQNQEFRLGLTEYWKEKFNEVNLKLENKKPEDHIHEFQDLILYREISQNINNFLNASAKQKYISHDELKANDYLKLSEIIQSSHSQHIPKWVLIIVGLLLLLGVLFAYFLWNETRNVNNVLNNKIQDLEDKIEKSRIKEAERSRKDIQERLSMGRISFIDGNYDKRHGVLESAQPDRFSQARDAFSRSLGTIKDDPEARIYYNNNRVKGLGAEEISETIAVSVPIRRNVTVAKEILRGVAQAQQEENDRWNACQNKSAAQDCQNVRPLQVLIASDDNDIEIAEKIANNLIENQKILAVIGHNASSVTKKVYEIYQNRLTLITPTSYSFDHSQTDIQDNYIFATIFPVQVSLSALIDYITTEFGGNRKLLFCSESGAHDKDILQAPFKEEKHRNKISFIQDAPNGSCDFGNKMEDMLRYHMRVSKETPTDLFLSSHVKNIIDSIILAREKKEKEYSLNLYSTMTLYTKDALLLGGDDIDEMILAVNWHTQSHNNDLNRRFINQAKGCWGDKFFDIDIDITWRTAMAYDATRVIIEGLKKIPLTDVKVTRKQLRDEIGNFSFLGVTGQIEFENNGKRKGGEGHLVKVDENKFKPFVKQDDGKYKLIDSKKIDSKDVSEIKCEQ